MIDTLGFFVVIDRQTYDWLQSRSILTQRIDQETGNIEFEYSNFSIHQSWNYKVMFRIDTKSWQHDINAAAPVYAEGIPHIRFEFSAPKILWGHNLDSCNKSDAFAAVRMVKDAFEKKFEVKLDSIFDWYCYRIDTCANYILDSAVQVKNYIRYLQRLDYPRRHNNKKTYGDNSLYFSSRQSTLKIYAKGEEFKAHDAKRFLDEVEQRRLYNKALCICRFEVEHKNRLRYIKEKLEEQKILVPTFQGYMRVHETVEHFDEVTEMERIICKFLGGTETRIMRNLDVFRLLKLHMSEKAARSMYAIYMLLVTQGQDEAKRQVSKPTYYRATKTFRELGISIILSDVERTDYFLDRGFPNDFELTMSRENKFYQWPKAA